MNGLLLIDKPSGITSHDVVSQVRKILQTREVGHSGTLDPMATGLMVLLLGEATKLSSFVTDGDKSYQVQFKLGIETDTLDSTGEILRTSEVKVDAFEVERVALALSGEMSLPVPMYSARKIDGKKMYEYARDKIVVEQPEKVMKFWGLEKLKSEPEHTFEFKISCSKGSFIRSWVEQLGKRLGCGAVMTGLRRTRSHLFNISEAITLENLKIVSPDELKTRLVPLIEALGDFKKIKIKDLDLHLLKNGQIGQGLRRELIRLFNPEHDLFVRVHSDRPEALVAVVALDPNKGFVIRRIFNS